MEIKEFLASSGNYTACNSRNIEYIVVHYTANDGDTAYANCNYFSTSGRGASAHYFVDENEVYQSVADNNIAWHCGATSYKHDDCRNSNSIGVEMCSRKNDAGDYYFKDETVSNAVELVKSLVDKYGVDENHVVRHYDVTGKICPGPFVYDENQWTEFKGKLEDEEVEEVRYNTIDELPSWAKDIIIDMVADGKIADENNLDLSMDMLRILVMMNR